MARTAAKKSHMRKMAAKPVKRLRQARLPGMEDSPIKDLEDAAIEHSEALSELVERRAAIKTIKTRIATLMKDNGKTSYNRAGIRLKLRSGEDTVSVQVKRHDKKESEETE